MKIGLSVTSHHTGPARDAVATMLDRVVAARDADLDVLSFGDHHAVGPDGQYIQGVPILARALAEWPSDRQAGLLFLVPMWHPVLMAELIGTLAAMSGRPLVVQTGIGHGAGAFAAMGASERTRGRETDRRIELVDRLLRGETVSDSDLSIANAAIGPTPEDGIEWWIGSGRAPAAIDRAARLGDALYISPGATVDVVAALVDQYRSRCAVHGRTPRVVLRRDVVLQHDSDSATALANALLARGYRGMQRDALVIGDASDAAAAFAAYRAVGADEIAARIASIPRPAAIEAISTLGRARLLMQ